MFTIFDWLRLALAGLGLWWGGRTGSLYFGIPGAIVGGTTGAFLGWIGGRLVVLAVLYPISKRLDSRTTEELSAELRSQQSLIPNVVLSELKRRDMVTSGDLHAIVDMLCADPFEHRTRGWVALSSAFPELAALIPDYQPSASLSDRERAVKPLRDRLERWPSSESSTGNSGAAR